jgi:transcription antitermination factor NusG
MLNWYALYTKPKKEMKVAQQLENLGFTVYLPTKVEIRHWSDRKKKVITPLFSSYVFIQIEDSKRASVFVIDGILNYVFWLGKPAVIKSSEIEIMQRELAKPYSSIAITSLEIGKKIQLTDSVFKGQNAVIEHISNTKVHLTLSSLGFKVIINRSLLEHEVCSA